MCADFGDIVRSGSAGSGRRPDVLPTQEDIVPARGLALPAAEGTCMPRANVSAALQLICVPAHTLECIILCSYSLTCAWKGGSS
jgi:hypothetical protein